MIVLDEIDGIDGDHSIEFLVKMVNQDKPAITRPILAICNDVWASSLRNLRRCEKAKVIKMGSVRTDRLMGRLRHICKAEKLSRQMLDDGVLLLLCQLCENDARSCINTLQFLSVMCHHKKQPITQSTLLKLNITSSSSNQNFHQDLSHLFTMTNTSSKKKGPTPSTSGASSSSAFHAVSSFTQQKNHDYLLTDGIFANYLSLPVDSNLERIVDMSDWFVFYDRCQSEILTNQNFEMQQYIPLLGNAANHCLRLAKSGYHSSQIRNLQLPKKLRDRHFKSKNVSDAIHDYVCNLSGPALNFVGLDYHTFLKDRLCYMLNVLDPLQPFHFQHLQRKVDPKRSKEVTSRLISGWRFYGFELVQNESKDGYRYKIDPDLRALVTFSTTAKPEFPKREIEGVLHNLFLQSRPEVVVEPVKGKQQLINAASTPSKKENRVMRDFFGRIITVEEKDKPEEQQIGNEDMECKEVKPVVKFKFNAGVTNAVRRSVYVRDFL